MESVIKLKLTLDEESQRVLQGQSRICNWLYNGLLEKANVLKEQYVKEQNEDIAKILYSKRGLRNLIPAMKSDHPFLKSVHSSPLKNVDHGYLILSKPIRNLVKVFVKANKPDGLDLDPIK